MKYECDPLQMKRHKERLDKANRSIQAVKEIVKDGIYRQQYHLMPQAYWMNDPNGFLYFKGKYHMYYQCNPYSTVWANMHWGHATSDDLINWEHQPIAIAPSEFYDDNIKGGVWSGTSLIHDNKMFVLYTACTTDGDKVSQKQCLAWSEDGYNFVKYADNPVLEAPDELDSADFRDPKVWKHENTFYCIVGTKKSGEACLAIFQSDDLIHWEYKGIFFEGYGMFGEMWECPDFFQLDEKYVIQFCPLNMGKEKSICLVGDFDYKTLKFTCDKVCESDAGFDFYAPQTVLSPDGRRIMIGYQNSWFWMPWFQDFGLSQLENWCSCMSLPRVLKFDHEGNLRFLPIKEVETLREEKYGFNIIEMKCGEKKELEIGDNIHFELQLEFDLIKNCKNACKLHLRNSEKEDTVIEFNFAYDCITCDKSKSYQNLGAVLCGTTSGGSYRSRISRNLCLKGKEKLKIQIFSDTSGIEIFVDEGKQVFTFNVFPDKTSYKVYLEAIGSDVNVSAKAWSLHPSDC